MFATFLAVIYRLVFLVAISQNLGLFATFLVFVGHVITNPLKGLWIPDSDDFTFRLGVRLLFEMVLLSIGAVSLSVFSVNLSILFMLFIVLDIVFRSTTKEKAS